MTIEITLDASFMLKALNELESKIFIMMGEHYGEFQELDRELNCNGIITNDHNTEL